MIISRTTSPLTHIRRIAVISQKFPCSPLGCSPQCLFGSRKFPVLYCREFAT